ncbi:MAG: hypothetical protein QXH26_04720 [Candidatus Hadarchaeales archaeon]
MTVSVTRLVLLLAFVGCLIAAARVEVPAQRAVALAAAVVLLATLYLYQPKPPPLPSQRLPVEDFTVWVETGGALSRLVGLDPQELRQAAQLAREDFRDLSANLELLASRLGILAERGHGEVSGLRELSLEVMRRVEVLSREFPEFPGRALEKKDFLLSTLEHSSTDMGYLSERLSELCRVKPPDVSTLLAQLQRQAEKMKESFRVAKSNLASLLERVKPPAPQPVLLVPLPEVPKPAPPPEEKPEEKPSQVVGQPPEAPPEAAKAGEQKPETPSEEAKPTSGAKPEEKESQQAPAEVALGG